MVDRLHLEKSYDLAMKIAENYTKLVDFIEEAKDNKFPPEELDDEQSEYNYDGFDDDNCISNSPQGSRTHQPSRKISPDPNTAWKSTKRPYFGEQRERNVRTKAF